MSRVPTSIITSRLESFDEVGRIRDRKLIKTLQIAQQTFTEVTFANLCRI